MGFGLPFGAGREKLHAHNMQTQDAPAEIIFKFWPWFEANRKRLAIAGAVVAVLVLAWFYISARQQQAVVDAGQAYTQFQLDMPPTPNVQQVVDGYLLVASKYPGTLAGQRARLEACATLFSAGRYADAQAQFQGFLAAETASPLAAQARLGIAASLEAQGKLDEALAAYRSAAGKPGSPEAIAAKFALGRVLELQGKLAEAVNAYQETLREPLAGSMANEAGQRIALLQAQLVPAKPAVVPSAKTPTP